MLSLHNSTILKLVLINFMLEDLDPLPHFYCHIYKTATELSIRIFYLVPIIQILVQTYQTAIILN
jgi:hypothetical protein